MNNTPYFMTGYAQAIPVPKRKQDSKKTPPNALLRDPYTNEVVPCLVRGIFSYGYNGKQKYVDIRRINLGQWTDKFGLAEPGRNPTVLRRTYPLMLEMIAFDEKTPDYFKDHPFVTLRFTSWRVCNNTQRNIHAAIITPLQYSELVEAWRDRFI